MKSIKNQIQEWATAKGLELVDNVGYLFSVCDNVELTDIAPNTIKVKECKNYTYIYLPMPTNDPYKYRYQVKEENGKAYILRYLFK